MRLCDTMRLCMYHDVWKCNVLAGGNKSRIACWRIELNFSFLLGMMNKDDRENKPVGEENSVGG